MTDRDNVIRFNRHLDHARELEREQIRLAKRIAELENLKRSNGLAIWNGVMLNMRYGETDGWHRAKNSEGTVTKHVGWIYRKRYAAHAVRRKRQRQLEAVVDKMVDRLIEKHFEITSDGKLQPKSTPQPRQ